ncbi:MAG: hypothetical protein EOO46_00430 [Flavobacterium sp.]|nr:MAG: hypothetical protein EOO46_00430 [Flavobacterium sp.]
MFDLKLNSNLISRNGHWLAYDIVNKDLTGYIEIRDIYRGSKSRYVLKNTKFSYTRDKLMQFDEHNEWFAFLDSDTLNIVNLKSLKKSRFANAKEFAFVGGGNYIIYVGKGLKSKNITLMDLRNFESVRFEDLKEFKQSPNGMMLALINGKDKSEILRCFNLNSEVPFATIIKKTGIIAGLTWSKSNTNLAFFEYGKRVNEESFIESIKIYTDLTTRPILKILDPSNTPNFPVAFTILKEEFFFSDDGNRFFFTLLKNDDNKRILFEDKDVAEDVKILQHNDNSIPSPEMVISNRQLFVWHFDLQNLQRVADDEHTQIILTGDQKNVLLYNNITYLPRFKYIGDYIDIYVKDLITGNKKIVIKKIGNSSSIISASPSGNYVIYFLEKNWWVYDVYKNTHTCITSGLNVSFQNDDYDRPGIKPPYGNAGWLGNDEKVIVYDQFDIWVLEPDGSKVERITHGRETNITYRVNNIRGRSIPGFSSFNAKKINAGDDILLTMLNNSNLDQGFCWWNKQLGFRSLLTKDKKLESGDYLPNRNKPFLFIESDFDVAPKLILKMPKGKNQIIYQNNVHQKNFHWGKSKLINYVGNGKSLKGALFYPANFDPLKKYPMVVHLYERKSQYLHTYFPPNVGAEIGFNPTIFTGNGYFVLYPDISYTTNEPGLSATKCIVSAVEKVLEMGSVNRDRIGLMGYSFGGYEAPFIISQTNMFRTAISGAGAHDLTDFYLSVSASGSNIWRFENQQWRIQAPFYSEGFQLNSTMKHILNINTPLLLFTGENDTEVDWQQSRKLQIALWRLGKKSTLLLYPGDAHGSFSSVHTKDLNMRVKTWFDYYLKDESPAEWIAKNINENK